MKNKLYKFIGILLFYTATPTIIHAHGLSPEVVVVLVYTGELRCGKQYPQLKSKMDSAYAAWKQRNKKYVESAEKQDDFAKIIADVNANKDKTPIQEEECQNFLKGLLDPSSDLGNEL